MRILNRVVRITPEGIRYEADPRHHELLLRSLGLEAGGSSCVTPGIKMDSEDWSFKGEDSAMEGEVMDSTGRVSKAVVDDDGTVRVDELGHDGVARPKTLEEILTGPEEEKMHAVRFRHVWLSDAVDEVHDVPAYEEIYGVHPRLVVANAHEFKRVSKEADPFTGKSGMVMRARIQKLAKDLSIANARRRRILLALMHHEGRHANDEDDLHVLDKFTVALTDGLSGADDVFVSALYAARTKTAKPKFSGKGIEEDGEAAIAGLCPDP